MPLRSVFITILPRAGARIRKYIYCIASTAHSHESWATLSLFQMWNWRSSTAFTRAAETSLRVVTWSTKGRRIRPHTSLPKVGSVPTNSCATAHDRSLISRYLAIFWACGPFFCEQLTIILNRSQRSKLRKFWRVTSSTPSQRARDWPRQCSGLRHGTKRWWCQSNPNPSPLFADEQVLSHEKVAPFTKSGVAFLFEPNSGV